MKIAAVSLLFVIAPLCSARADLTIVQQVDGLEGVKNMTIKIKGDKARVEAAPQVTTILDTKTGDITTLLNGQKRAMHLSAKKAKALAEMAKKFSGDKPDQIPSKPKFVPTGRKETINGYSAEEYTVQNGDFEGSFWIVPNYPGYEAIRREMEKMQSRVWNSPKQNMPDYKDLPGLPIRTIIKAPDHGVITNTIVSVSREPIPDDQFEVPKDFTETKMPDFMHQQAPPPAPTTNP